MKDKLRTTDLHEAIDLTEAVLNEAEYTVQNVRLIKSGWSLNEKHYLDEALAEAAHLWEGAKAYADHPGKEERRNRPERSIRDIVGYYTAPRHGSGSTMADMKVLGEARQWLWPLIQETVATRVPLVGLSINALGTTKLGEAEGKRGIIVEAITHAHSVDVVTTPAAGGGFTQLTASDDGGWTTAVLESLQLEELREARPDLVETLKREWKTTRDTDAIKEVRAEADTATTKLAALTEEYRTATEALAEALETISALRKEQMVDRLLSDKTLPDAWKLDLRETLLKAEQGEWVAIVEREGRKAEAIRPKAAVTGAGRLAPTIEATIPAHKPAPKNIDVPREDETYSAWLRRTGRTK